MVVKLAWILKERPDDFSNEKILKTRGVYVQIRIFCFAGIIFPCYGFPDFRAVVRAC